MFPRPKVANKTSTGSISSEDAETTVTKESTSSQDQTGATISSNVPELKPIGQVYTIHVLTLYYAEWTVLYTFTVYMLNATDHSRIGNSGNCTVSCVS